ncbi:hypothetical protein LXL04_006869 [Taraxacum kok-saghyz]
MDQTKLILAFLTVTLIINLQCVEGRHLKTTNPAKTIAKSGIHELPAAYVNANANEDRLTKPLSPTPPSETLVGSQTLVPPPPHGVEDFRPTTPGHSPGAGHSLHN